MKQLAYVVTGWLIFGSVAWAQGLKSPTFKTGTIQIKNITLKAEFALTPEQQAYGLMNRDAIPDDFGMLFIFEDEDIRSFWMKDTFVDLSLAYIDANKRIFQILDMKASKSSTDINLTSYESTQKAKYVLEVKQGWFKKNKIKVGDKMKKYHIN